MTIIEAIILGVIQGVTEFLPISSSGHLIIAGSVLDLDDKFIFDVLLNLGSLGALIWYSWADLKSIISKVFKKDYSLGLKIIAATIPAALTGFFFNDIIEDFNGQTQLVAAMLLLIGFVMVWVKQKKKPYTKLSQITWQIALTVGAVQAIALIPGTSRSGITIIAGLMLGLHRSLAAKWSFLLAIPIITGATFKTMLSQDGIELLSDNLPAVVAGNIASFIAGAIAITGLMALLKTKSLKSFGYYRIALGLLLIVLVSANILE